MNYQDHFESNPDVCAGQVVFRGTRVILRTILASIAAGDTDEKLLHNFPALTAADLRAAIAFAAAAAVENMPLPPLPSWAEAAVEEEPSRPVTSK